MSIEFVPFYFFYQSHKNERESIVFRMAVDDAMSTQKNGFIETILSSFFVRKNNESQFGFTRFCMCVSIERRTTEWNADDSTAINNLVEEKHKC